MIPARYKASRFPGKLVQDLCGLPVISRTYRAAKDSQLFNEIYVITDSPEISKYIEQQNGICLMSEKEYQSGSDRIAEAAVDIDTDIIVNIQGDEPFINKKAIKSLLQIFENDPNQKVDLATLKETLNKKEDIENPNNVKVITDINNNALYFSRSVIPYPRDNNTHTTYYKHIGIYAYRKKALLDFTNLPLSTLEKTEKLEQLRYLENGYRIKVALTQEVTIGIDTPQDLEKARKIWQKYYDKTS